MLNVVMLCVIMLNVIMLNVIAPNVVALKEDVLTKMEIVRKKKCWQRIFSVGQMEVQIGQILNLKIPRA